MQAPEEYWDKYKNKRITQNCTEGQKENIEHRKAALAMTKTLIGM